MRQMMKRRLEDAGLPELFSPHSFRVTVVTDLLNQNVPLEDVQYLAVMLAPPPRAFTIGDGARPAGYRRENLYLGERWHPPISRCWRKADLNIRGTRIATDPNGRVRRYPTRDRELARRHAAVRHPGQFSRHRHCSLDHRSSKNLVGSRRRCQHYRSYRASGNNVCRLAVPYSAPGFRPPD